MASTPEFAMRIAKAVLLPEEGAGKMTIIIRRPYAFLEKELRNAFKEQEDVKVILDRRNGKQGKRREAAAKERRGANRRRPKEELVEVVISLDQKS
jgi:hypothetical protein